MSDISLSQVYPVDKFKFILSFVSIRRFLENISMIDKLRRKGEIVKNNLSDKIFNLGIPKIPRNFN